jgi:hypothetical protein
MAFHEKAGPGQVDLDLPFLRFPFPSYQSVLGVLRYGLTRSIPFATAVAAAICHRRSASQSLGPVRKHELGKVSGP